MVAGRTVSSHVLPQTLTDLDRACREHWHISFLVEDGRSTPDEHALTSAVGVDRGVTAACSDGTMRDRQFRTLGQPRRYRKLRQQLARRQRGSTNRRKTLAAMRRIERRERDRQSDFVSWTAKRHGLVALEKLPVRNMTRSAKSTVEDPGTRVAQKAGLNRGILDKGWHAFELALRDMARRTGCRILAVPAPDTSQRCSACRVVDPESRESQAVYCGHNENADVNAAKNVLADGLSVAACGDLGVTWSVQQEPGGNPRGVTTSTRRLGRLESPGFSRGEDVKGVRR